MIKYLNLTNQIEKKKESNDDIKKLNQKNKYI